MTVTDEGIIYTDLYDLVKKWIGTNDNQLNHQAIKILSFIQPFNMPQEAWADVKHICNRYIDGSLCIIHMDTDSNIYRAILNFYWWLPDEERVIARDIVNNLPDSEERGLKRDFFKEIYDFEDKLSGVDFEPPATTENGMNETEIIRRIQQLEASVSAITDVIGQAPDKLFNTMLLQQEIKILDNRIQQDTKRIETRLEDWKTSIDQRFTDLMEAGKFKLNKWTVGLAIAALLGLPTIYKLGVAFWYFLKTNPLK